MYDKKKKKTYTLIKNLSEVYGIPPHIRWKGNEIHA